MSHFLAAGLFVLALTSAGRAQDDAKKVIEALQGEWKIISFHKDGDPEAKDRITDAKMTFAGEKITLTMRKKDEPLGYTLDLKANPPAIDLKVDEEKRKLVVKGIYKLDKDALTICFGLGESDRPKDFKPAKGNGVFVLERAKK